MSEGAYLQRFIIFQEDHPPFMTEWFDAENHFNEGMTVFNTRTGEFTTDGESWNKIERDHL